MDDYYLVIANILTGTITFVSFILCFINIYFFKNLKNHCKALSLYIIICFLFDFTNTTLIYFNYHNIGLLPLFNITELLLLIYFMFPKNPYSMLNKITVTVGILINLYEFGYYLNTNDYIINKGRIFNALFFLAIILYKLTQEIQDTKYLQLIYSMLIYFTICFIQFFLLDFLVNIPNDSIFITWMLYAIAGCVLYYFSTYYLWKIIKTSNM